MIKELAMYKPIISLTTDHTMADHAQIIAEFEQRLLDNMVDLDGEYSKLIDEHYAELI